MNIFILDLDMKRCAEYMVDSHCTKMILEHSQMLSTACRLSGLEVGYKITHLNHPCNIWARTSLSNWLYLRDLTKSIHEEWQYRYGHAKNHKAYDVVLSLPVPRLPDNGMTPFAQAMPVQYRGTNAVNAYRSYYNGDKRHLFKWKNREVPTWIT